jgi:hypothetical protein
VCVAARGLLFSEEKEAKRLLHFGRHRLEDARLNSQKFFASFFQKRSPFFSSLSATGPQ